jgi:hypothetical protein
MPAIYDRSRARYLILVIVLHLAASAAGCTVETPATAAAFATATATPAPTATLTPAPSPTASPTRPPTSTIRPTVTSTVTPEPRPTRPSLDGLAAQYPQLAPLLNHPEVAAVYKELAVAYEQGGQQAMLALAQQRGLVTPEGEFRAELVLDTPDADVTMAQLEALGIRVLGVQDDAGTGQRRVQIAIPPALLISGAQHPGAILVQLVALEHVVGLTPPR